MSLRACADSAEDVATGFMMFRPPLPEHATEITGLMADLYSISVALKRLDDMSANRAYRYNLPQIQPDLDMVLNSLAYTLEDVIGYFNVLERGASSSQKLFKRTWSDLVSFFWDESQESLSTRLGKYRSLLNELQYEVMEYVQIICRFVCLALMTNCLPLPLLTANPSTLVIISGPTSRPFLFLRKAGNLDYQYGLDLPSNADRPTVAVVSILIVQSVSGDRAIAGRMSDIDHRHRYSHPSLLCHQLQGPSRLVCLLRPQNLREQHLALVNPHQLTP